ncbi:MAG: DUF6946 family protein [Mycobacterium leprae]
MGKIHIPAHTTDDWRWFWTDPLAQWRSDDAAKQLAERWQGADDFPPSVRRALQASGPIFSEARMMLGIPDRPLPLPGNGAASRSELFVLARVGAGLAVFTVEGTITESFGPTIEEWGPDQTEGHQTRFDALTEALGLEGVGLMPIRYRLLSRAAAVLRIAQEFCACCAVLLIHSFDPDNALFEDYREFVHLFGTQAQVGRISLLTRREGIYLYAGWVQEHR